MARGGNNRVGRPSRKEQLATLQDEVLRAKTWRRDNHKDDLWRRMKELYEGEFMPNSNREDQMRVNLAFSTVNVIAPNIALDYPAIGVVAKNAEDDDRAVIAEQVLNYWWKHYDFHSEFQRAVKDSIIYGFGWCKVGWLYAEEDVPVSEQELQQDFQRAMQEQQEAAILDPGIVENLPSEEDVWDSLPRTKKGAIEDRPFVTRISPHDVFVSPEATSMNDLRWIAHRIVKRKDQVMADTRYSPKARHELAGGLREDDPVTDQRMDDWHRYTADEWVICWEFYDLEKNEMSVFADSADTFLLAPRPMPYAYGHPFQMLRNYDIPEDFYPKGDLEEIEDMVHEISKTRSQMLQWRQKYATKYLVRDGAIDANDVDKLTNRRDGQIILVKDNESELQDIVIPVPINNLDARLFDWSQQIMMDVNEITGVSEIARGSSGAGTQTATEASLLQDAQNARTQAKLVAVEKFISNIARKLQQLGQQFLTGEHYVRILGPEDAAMYVPYDRDDITGEFDFEVEAGSTQPQNETFRRQQAIALMQTMAPFLEMGIVDPLRLAEHVLKDGFGVRNAQKFLTPQAIQALQQMDAMMQQGQQGPQGQQALPGVAGPGGQPGALAAPGNGVGLDAPQPPPAQRQDMNQQAQDAPSY